MDVADYQTLLRKADTVLKEVELASKELLVMPGGSVTLNMPMDEDADLPQLSDESSDERRLFCYKR
ncbi:hypothetical protein ACRN83_001535 [Enterobacter hormaechei]